ncbi:DUF1405 domain-containing protein [Staphylococcus capitis]
MLFNKHSAILNALAFVTLIKYGVWAVIMKVYLLHLYKDLFHQ